MPERRQDTLPKNRKRTPGQTAGTPISPTASRRTSRREREARQRRQLYWGVGIALSLAAVIVIGISINQFVVKPRHVLATVNGTDIRRRDYWKVRSIDLINQVNQYSSFSQNPSLDASQQQQYLSLAQTASKELDDVWGTTSIDDATLNRMVEDQVYLKNAGDLGVSVTDTDIDSYITEQFQPADAPIITPTPSPTLIPARAEWATETAVSIAATATANAVTPDASPQASPVEGGATPIAEAATPALLTSDAATPAEAASRSAVAVEATPIDVGTPAATPIAEASPETTPEDPATPNAEQARETVTARYDTFKDKTLSKAHMSESDFRELVARPAVVRQKVRDAVQAPIGQSAEQVHAAHILVETKDLADAIYQQVTQPGADFGAVAKGQSSDTATAENGGDLGWFTHAEMVKAFEDVAFSTPPGVISQPFQTEFGWHIVQVIDHQSDRPMTDQQISNVKEKAVTDWVEAQRAGMKISSDLKPTPTPSVKTFEPPADAPPLPTPTIEGEQPTTSAEGASPEAATPVGSVATPLASPVASPTG